MAVDSSEGVRDVTPPDSPSSSGFSASTSCTSSLLFEDTESPKSQTSRAGRAFEVSVLGASESHSQDRHQTTHHLHTLKALVAVAGQFGWPRLSVRTLTDRSPGLSPIRVLLSGTSFSNLRSRLFSTTLLLSPGASTC